MRFLGFIAAFAALCSADGNSPASLFGRIDCQSNTIRQTQKVGNGNPHQNFVFKQVSGVTDCNNNPSGSAAVTETLTVGWSVSIGGAADFITGGFDVSQSHSTGFTNSFGCKTNSGTHKGNLCVFERIQVTAFTADTRQCTVNSCTGTTCGPWHNKVVISAPNSVQGSCFYNNFQVNLPCGPLGTEHHIKKGPAGGPQFVSCEPTHSG